MTSSAVLLHSLKEECICLHHFKTLEEAKKVIEAWVKFYNEQRPHQAFGYLSPVELRHLNAPQLPLKVA